MNTRKTLALKGIDEKTEILRSTLLTPSPDDQEIPLDLPRKNMCEFLKKSLERISSD
jgi:hypothetical protein